MTYFEKTLGINYSPYDGVEDVFLNLQSLLINSKENETSKPSLKLLKNKTLNCIRFDGFQNLSNNLFDYARITLKFKKKWGIRTTYYLERQVKSVFTPLTLLPKNTEEYTTYVDYIDPINNPSTWTLTKYYQNVSSKLGQYISVLKNPTTKKSVLVVEIVNQHIEPDLHSIWENNSAVNTYEICPL